MKKSIRRINRRPRNKKKRKEKKKKDLPSRRRFRLATVVFATCKNVSASSSNAKFNATMPSCKKII
jgi:hypothetical protein